MPHKHIAFNACFFAGQIASAAIKMNFLIHSSPENALPGVAICLAS